MTRTQHVILWVLGAIVQGAIAIVTFEWLMGGLCR